MIFFKPRKSAQLEQPATAVVLKPRPYYTTLAKIALLARALGTFPLPYPLPPSARRSLGKARSVALTFGGARLYVHAFYGPAATAVATVLSKPIVRVSSSAYVSSFINTVSRIASELSESASNALVVFGQAPLDLSYASALKLSNAPSSGAFLPTPRVVDRCSVVESDDMCTAENLSGAEKLAVLVDSGLIMSVLYVFKDTPSAGLQLQLYTERASSGAESGARS